MAVLGDMEIVDFVGHLRTNNDNNNNITSLLNKLYTVNKKSVLIPRRPFKYKVRDVKTEYKGLLRLNLQK